MGQVKCYEKIDIQYDRNYIKSRWEILNHDFFFSLTDERLDERDGEQSAAILFDLYKKAIFNNSR